MNFATSPSCDRRMEDTFTSVRDEGHDALSRRCWHHFVRVQFHVFQSMFNPSGLHQAEHLQNERVLPQIVASFQGEVPYVGRRTSDAGCLTCNTLARFGGQLETKDNRSHSRLCNKGTLGVESTDAQPRLNWNRSSFRVPEVHVFVLNVGQNGLKLPLLSDWVLCRSFLLPHKA